MAVFEDFLKRLLKVEGGWVFDVYDEGGATNKGITLKTFKKYYDTPEKEMTWKELRNIEDYQVEHIYKTGYWDVCRADEIESQRIANLLVDMAVNSGVKTAVRMLQEILGITQDGIVGPITLAAINSTREDLLYNLFRQRRIDFYYDLCENKPTNRKFIRGWLNRLNYYDR